MLGSYMYIAQLEERASSTFVCSVTSPLIAVGNYNAIVFLRSSNPHNDPMISCAGTAQESKRDDVFWI